MNNISIIGRLCADPELKQTPNGVAVCTVNIAVKRPYVKDTTDFFSAVLWRQQAEYIAKYGHKGDPVGVTGYLTTREYTTQDGQKRTATEIVGSAVEILRSRSEAPQTASPAAQSQGPYNSPASPQVMSEVYVPDQDDDLPF